MSGLDLLIEQSPTEQNVLCKVLGKQEKFYDISKSFLAKSVF